MTHYGIEDAASSVRSRVLARVLRRRCRRVTDHARRAAVGRACSTPSHPGHRTDADRAFAALVRTHFDDLMARQPDVRDVPRHPRPRRRGCRTCRARRTLDRRRGGAALPVGPRGDRPGSLSPANVVRARAGHPRARRRPLRRRGAPRLGAARPRRARRSATRCSCCSRATSRRWPERLESIAARLEAAPARAARRSAIGWATAPSRLWLELELEIGGEPARVPRRHRRGRPRGARATASPNSVGWSAPSAGARAALDDYAGWLRGAAATRRGRLRPGAGALRRRSSAARLRRPRRATTSWTSARSSSRPSTRRGAQRPPSSTQARRKRRSWSASRRDHPATFDEALAGYRDVDGARPRLHRRARPGDAARGRDARRHPDARVPARGDALRGLLPAGGLRPAQRRGIYIVTPSVDGDAGAMLEHNWASISNTSIHEAYPGHHHQLSAALERPTLTRLLIDAPEFVEGWGMYCEQLMREHGFDATPAHRMIAGHRCHLACLPDHPRHPSPSGRDRRARRRSTSSSRTPGSSGPTPPSEVHRYTSTPTYQLTYLLGKVLILRLREDERRRLGAAFSLRGFHDALLWSGSIPVSFHRRLLAGEGGGPFAAGRRRRRAGHGRVTAEAGCAADAGHPQHRPGRTGGPRLVWWPGAGSGDRRAHRSARSASRARSSRLGAPVIHLVDLDGARAGRPANLGCHRRGRPGRRRAAPGGRRRRRPRAGRAARSRRARRASSLPLWAVAEDRDAPGGLPPHRRRLAGRGPGRAPRAAARRTPGSASCRRRCDELVGELAAAGVRRFVLSHGGAAPGPGHAATAGRAASTRTCWWPAA